MGVVPVGNQSLLGTLIGKAAKRKSTFQTPLKRHIKGQ